MQVLKTTLIVSCLTLNLSACGWLAGDDGFFRDRGNDYRQARVESPLQLPERLSEQAIGDNYAIPPIKDRASLSQEFEVPRPEPLDEAVDRESVRINSLGQNRWILVNGSPGQVWPRLRGFLNLNQLPVQRADATSGILETAWLQPQGEGMLKERYRLRIDQGVQRGTSEVYVLQADLRDGLEGWPQRSTNSEREQLMTQELAQYLADSAAAAAVSMLAQQAIESSGRLSLIETDEHEFFLKLDLPFSRAWAGVGLALEKAGFTVDDKNREQRVYYLHYVDTEESDDKPGFFSRLFGGRGKDELGKPYLLYIRETDGESVLISIRDKKDKVLDAEETKKRLKLIKKHLS